ncbi:M23 family metallopeptidase [Leucobacter massiliensis]|uniref:M23ase beta-sheet core domain-containing protein n=1 Tax=Leucobacter massiliensis TaxID=1686285 RepID=A0A2S9QMV2_9MICO|nr:M23 family metallopeptidase [Leucobacter massiliensis]PRI10910.1 hypothetical protein B4915_08475 [Leucobacter massiliensis]
MATDQIVLWPSLNPVITEEAGTRGGTHMGIDLAAQRGDAVIAPFDGVVIFAGGDGASGRLPGTDIWANGQAKVVRIRRADGLIAHLAHLDTIEVAAGQVVKAGQRIGGAGDTGWSTGVHIHWELRWDEYWNGGNWINPRTMNPVIFTGTTEGEEDMRGIIYRSTEHGKHGVYAGPTGGFVILQNAEEAANLKAIGTPEVWLTPKTLQELIADARKMQR